MNFEPPQESLTEQIVRIGLYIGAAFQICCLLAVVIYHANPSDGVTALKVCSNAGIFYYENILES